MTQAHLFISGIVQGVGYRQFVKSHARRLGLTGWVRNLEDGRVEIVIQGKKELVEKLISLCEQGPMLSEVRDVSIAWGETKEEYVTFDII